MAASKAALLDQADIPEKERGKELVKAAEAKPDSLTTKEPVTVIGLIALVVVLAVLLALLVFSEPILGKNPSKVTIGLVVGVVLAVVAVAQMFFTRKEVFAPTTLDKILEVFASRIAPPAPAPQPPAPNPGPAPPNSEDARWGGLLGA